MLRIRKARPSDFNSVYGFINELETTVFDKKKQLRIFRRNLANPDILYLVADHSGEVVGFLSCHIQWLLHHCSAVAEIQEMFVARFSRGKSIGKKLLDELKKRMRTKGIKQIEAVSNQRRTRAHKLYTREQFRMTSCKFVFVERHST